MKGAALATIMWLAAVAASGECVPVPPAEGWTLGNRRLAWRDEFSGKQLDHTKWNIAFGDGGWGNRELQTYTDQPVNLQLERGKLVLTAVRDGEERYTSARLDTSGKFTFQYGRVEARIKLPSGRGLWPAFWLMSVDKRGPDDDRPCAEVDIMESIGSEPGKIHSTLHTPKEKIATEFSLPGGMRLADKFHEFAVEWDPHEARFYVDRKLFRRVLRGELSPWVFDRQFILVVNLAVGGEWPGPPDAKTKFPQSMQIDWIRVWQK